MVHCGRDHVLPLHHPPPSSWPDGDLVLEGGGKGMRVGDRPRAFPCCRGGACAPGGRVSHRAPTPGRGVTCSSDPKAVILGRILLSVYLYILILLLTVSMKGMKPHVACLGRAARKVFHCVSQESWVWSREAPTSSSSVSCPGELHPTTPSEPVA